MPKHGKKYLEAKGRVDRTREYTPAQAVKLVKELKTAKFDETVEIHVRTGLNVRHADEQLRGTIALPNGLGKEVKIAVFAKGDKAREAEEAGADVVGAEDLAQQIQDGLHRLRRRDRDAGPHAGGRPPRPHPRPAGQDAEPEGRDGHHGRPPRG
jgi:ribosomal protein L1